MCSSFIFICFNLKLCYFNLKIKVEINNIQYEIKIFLALLESIILIKIHLFQKYVKLYNNYKKI